jgi:hypothetical protein
VKADLDAQVASRPKTADEYQPTLPKEAGLPDGVEVKTDDPAYKAFRELALESGLPQDVFSKILAFEAKRELDKTNQIKAGIAKRDAELGSNGAARVEALHRWTDSFFDPDTARDFKAALVTPKQIAALEKIQTALSSQGVTPFSGAHREGAPDPNALPAGYDKWSAIDKRTYQLAKQQGVSASAAR